MADKTPLDKVQDALRSAMADPSGAAVKAAEQARGVVALGFLVVGQAAQSVGERLMRPPEPPPSAPGPVITPREQQPTPADVAKVAKKAPAKKAPAKKAPAKKAPAKATPSAKLPAKKASATATPPAGS